MLKNPPLGGLDTVSAQSYIYNILFYIKLTFMGNNSLNGNANGLAQYETPFADIPVMREFKDQSMSPETFFSDYLQEVESPFSRTYEANSVSNGLTQSGEEFVDFLGELNDAEFNETIYGLANEVEDSWRNKVSNELAMGSNYIPFATQQAQQYFSPLITETESMIDRVSQHFSGNNLADHSVAEIESFFEQFELSQGGYTPVQEQFFGKIFDKVKSVVKKGVDLAKKGISAVGKLMPLNFVLNKIKGLIKPLLDKVLKFAIGKLPKNLQPYARTFAKKFLNLETGNESEAIESEDQLEAIQTEFDAHIAQLLFSPNEPEAQDLLQNYEFSLENLERTNNYESGYVNMPSLDVARQQFMDELKNLQPGETAAPAIERFLPAVILALQPVIKIALTLIGRQKVINFLAGILAKLVGKYVPENIAKPLAASIIDVGMSAIGFEVHETGKADLAYEAITNTIEETVQNMISLNESSLNDTEDISMQLLEAFEKAAANNFPSQYIKESLRPTKQKAVWVSMPRETPVKLYKKFTHVYDVIIDSQIAAAVTTYRSLPLANFLKDKYGLDTSKPIKAKVHLYETRKGTRLNLISKYEKLPGLNSRQPKAWVQLLPLTSKAATLLLKEPAMGKDSSSKALATRFRTRGGHRYYYLEIEGVKLRLPVTGNITVHDHRTAAINPNQHTTVHDHRTPQVTDHRNNVIVHDHRTKIKTGTESRSADIQAIINFIKSEIKLNYYFSEEDAKAVVEKLNKNDFLGAGMSIRQSVKNVLNDMLTKNVQSKVKIIHESIPELYLENINDSEEEFAPLEALGKIAGKGIISKIIEKLVDKLSKQAYDAVVDFFKARAAEFKDAQAQPQDGVTIKLTWNNIHGMSVVRTVINAIRGNLSIGNLTDMALPNLPAATIKIEAGKKFN